MKYEAHFFSYGGVLDYGASLSLSPCVRPVNPKREAWSVCVKNILFTTASLTVSFMSIAFFLLIQGVSLLDLYGRRRS